MTTIQTARTEALLNAARLQQDGRTEPAYAPAFTLVDTLRIRLRTLREARGAAQLAARMYSDPPRAETGLYEFFVNAVEHGCLGIGHDLKTKLLETGTWDNEIARRERLPENRLKEVDIVVARKEGGVYAVVTDPGNGFDWKFWTAIDPARAGEPHGRGITRARGISFDSIAYNKQGNQVAAFTRDTPPLQW